MLPAEVAAIKSTPYWWEDAPPFDGTEVALPSSCDVAVIGGGFAGLCAALELARNGAATVVLDSGALGGGASTRNSGSVSVRFDIAKVMRALGSSPGVDAQLVGLARNATESIDFVEKLIAREAIECDYAVRGSYLAAVTPRHYGELARRSAAMRKYFGVEAHVVPRSDQRSEIGSDFYYGGMVNERTGQLHPSRYHRGLVEACRRAGATLAPHTAVTRLHREGGSHVLETPRGQLRAREVLVATNGHTGTATPALKRRVIPVASHIIVTEPLRDAIVKEILPRRRVVSDSQRLLCYFRLTPDGRRLLFGGRVSQSDAGPGVIALRLRRRMIERFPQFERAAITHAWGGQVAFTFDHLPHMGREGDWFYALGCNANGVAIMSYLGHQSARRILGGVSPVCAFDGRGFPARAYYRGRPWFLPMVSGWYRFCDWAEKVIFSALP